MDTDLRYIGPTILDNILPDDPVMEEEIFGPVLPVRKYDDIDRAMSLVKKMPPPCPAPAMVIIAKLFKVYLPEWARSVGYFILVLCHHSHQIADGRVMRL